jgi:CHAD domain-containing protein
VQPGGLDFWMAAVTKRCKAARRTFDPAAVHDLRVALRRCRSVADGWMALDPHPAWKQMKTESRWLFRQLGALRDTQVMLQWIKRLSPIPDEAAIALTSYLEEQEDRHRHDAESAIRDFSGKKWAAWRRQLLPRTRNLPMGGAVFQHLALERWLDLKEFHRMALRDRSQAAYHRVRLALKRFRYTVENFLPSRRERWGPELKEIQFLLGDMHDLDVLWRTALTLHAIHSEDARRQWHQHICKESRDRLERYRAKMAGRTSRLLAWGEELPRLDQLQAAALARFRAWASFRDPDVFRSEHVSRLSLQIYDGLESLGLTHGKERPEERWMLETAALARTVGIIEGQRKYQTSSYRLIRKLKSLVGLDADTIQQIALVVRFHRGSLPRSDHKAMAGISGRKLTSIIMLSGILRLADALDRLHGVRMNRLRLHRQGNTLFITAPGYSGGDISAEKLAGARHLLECACRMPVLIRGPEAE